MTDSLRQLQDRLSEITAQLGELREKIIKGEAGVLSDECVRLRAAECRAEFELAMARGEEAAEVIEWPFPWSAGGNPPYVVSNQLEAHVIYAVRPPLNADDSSALDLSPGLLKGRPPRLAIIKFSRCHTHRFGGPNDEVARGHPLHGRGLAWYEAHRIHNSQWIASEERINSVHSNHNPQHWRGYQHYLLCFHDCVFECIAEGYEAESIEASHRDVMGIAVDRVLG